MSFATALFALRVVRTAASATTATATPYLSSMLLTFSFIYSGTPLFYRRTLLLSSSISLRNDEIFEPFCCLSAGDNAYLIKFSHCFRMTLFFSADERPEDTSFGKFCRKKKIELSFVFLKFMQQHKYLYLFICHCINFPVLTILLLVINLI